MTALAVGMPSSKAEKDELTGVCEMHKFCFLTWRESKEALHSALPPFSPSFIDLLRTKVLCD